MSWTAVVPLKGGPSRKSRLAGVLDEAARAELSDAMAAHVLGRLGACVEIAELLLLAPERPGWAKVGWRRDHGRGLNAELTALRAGLPGVDLLVVHADLPLLDVADVEAMLDVGDIAIAPDRHGLGTNALALRRGRAFDYAFGSQSCARHRADAPEAVIVSRTGLQLDIDTPQDLEAARRAGFDFTAALGTAS